MKTGFRLYKLQRKSIKMIHILTGTLLGLLFLATGARAQFQFFEQMFGGGQEQQQQDPRGHSAPSDSSWYQRNYDNGMSHLILIFIFSFSFSTQNANRSLYLARCADYLCPGTLACVSVPHHCPCQHPAVEDKFELGDGSAICVSKGGFKPGEAARKVELARKGLL